ncbi:hypothetical protein ORM30_20895 [Bacillus cereus]|nr:hypothetical protein [Bacillus cereus]
MTLIAGIILPKGILMVSDSREQIEITDEVHNEYKRKITMVTPTNILGSAGFSTTFCAAQILRQTLFKNNAKFTSQEIRRYILEFYQHVNLLHLVGRDPSQPVGQILLAELDLKDEKYCLLSNYGIDRFKNFTIYNKVKDVVLIGAHHEIRNSAKQQIQYVLDSLDENSLNLSYIYEPISLACHKIFKDLSVIYNGINDKLYCVYISTIEGKPSSSFYFLESDGSDHRIDEHQDGEIISYTR